MKILHTLLLGLLLVSSLWSPRTARAGGPKEGHELVGRPAAEWTGLHFLGPQQKLADLRGRVVLVRFFNDECPLCAATAPSLEQLHEQHEKDGLSVIGIYHPKPDPRKVTDDQVRRTADKLGLHFPIAVDADWTVLRRYWLGAGKRAYTSVSFLIDRSGVIRWIHPGGEFHPSIDPLHKECDAAHRELQQVVAGLLREPAVGTRP